MLDRRPGGGGGLVEGRVQAAVGADQLREGVQVGRLELRHLAPLLDRRDDLVLVADRLEHAGVGREAGLAAALARQAELLEQDRRELLRRADRELLPGQLPDAPLQLDRALVEARADRAQALDVELDARRAPSPPARRPAAARSRGRGSVSPSSSSRSRWRSASSAREHGALGDAVARRRCCAPEAGLGGQLVERVAAPRGVDQVGRDHRVVRQRRRVAGLVGHRDRLPVVRHDRAARRAPSRTPPASRPRPRAPRRPPRRRP